MTQLEWRSQLIAAGSVLRRPGLTCKWWGGGHHHFRFTVYTTFSPSGWWTCLATASASLWFSGSWRRLTCITSSWRWCSYFFLLVDMWVYFIIRPTWVSGILEEELPMTFAFVNLGTGIWSVVRCIRSGETPFAVRRSSATILIRKIYDTENNQKR